MNRPSLKTWQWLLLALVVVVALDWLIQRPDSRTRALNDALAQYGSAQLKNYPYPFRVFRVEGSTAVMGTPRNFDMPAFRFLGMLHPEVNVKDANNPEFIRLEKTLGEVQSEARTIIGAQPGISSVRWELDKNWLQSHGLEVPDKR